MDPALTSLLRLEENYSLGTAETSAAVFPSVVPDPTTEAYRLSLITRDFRRAEALSGLSAIHPLVRARVLFSRGKLRQSSETLETYQNAGAEVDETTRCEFLLERARHANANAEWALAEELSNQALLSSPTPVTRMTLHQVRSIARFEAGNLSACLEDLDVIATLGTIYPAGIIPFYGRALHVKALTQLGAWSDAQNHLNVLWKDCLESSKFTADHLLTLLRAQVELKTRAGVCPITDLLSTYVVAEYLGDTLYVQLALAELSLSSSACARKAATETLASERDLLPRARALLKSRGTEGPGSASSEDRTKASQFAFLWQMARTPRGVHSIFIDLSGQKATYRYHLPTGRLESLKLQPRIREALSLLCRGPIPKAEFFTAVWKITRFNPELHDETVRTLLARVRKQTGLIIQCTDGLIISEGAWVIR